MGRSATSLKRWWLSCDRSMLVVLQVRLMADRAKLGERSGLRGRVCLTDGSCIRLRQKHRNYVWSSDVVKTAPL